MKRFLFLLILFMLVSSVFAFTQTQRLEAINYMVGNTYRVPLMLGSYNTNIILVKQNPMDSFWFACFPTKINSEYTHVCNVCEACN